MSKREDIETEIARAKYFSHLDANSGFPKIPFVKATSTICTFDVPFEPYHSLSLPFGIASAPEVFKKKL